MKISRKWLSDILNIKNISDDFFVNKMTTSGFNVEKYYNFSNIKNIYTGKIIDIINHPNNNKLFICKINIFYDHAPYQIITRSDVVKVGDIIPVALENSILNNNIIIKKIMLNNIISYGTLCGINELGINKYDEPNIKIKNEIIIFPKNTKIGLDIKKLLDMDDTIFDIEITNNRNDCCTAYGLAMEISSIFDIKFKYKTNKNNNSKFKNFIKIKKSLLKNINSFFFQIIKINKNKVSPRWLRRRLSVIDIIPKNNFIIDIINYLQYLYGYNTHILKINNYKNLTLDYKENNIIFKDKNKILSEYLVMNSDKYNNNDILLLANINMKRNFINKENPKYIKNNYLLLKSLHHSYYNTNYEYFTFKLNSFLNTKYNIILENDFYINKIIQIKKLSINFNKINQILGVKINTNIILDIFKRLHFKYNIKNKILYLPTYRDDINNINDISEEIFRIYICNNKTIEKEKSLPIKENNFYEKYKFKNQICELCRYVGFDEIMTLPFLNNNYSKLLNLKINESEVVYINNPINEENNCMRYTIIPSMIEILASIKNKDKHSNVNIYEIGKIYLYKNNNYIEKETLCLISNNVQNILEFKEKILIILKDIININLKQTKIFSWLHKYQQAIIYSNDLEIGYIGKIHPKISNEMNLNDNMLYIAEIYYDKLFLLRKKYNCYEKISKFPSINRDLSLICNKFIPANEIQKIILDSDDNNFISKINLFDTYYNEKFGLNKICLSFSITFTDNKKTLTDNVVETIINKILYNLNNKYEIKIRLV